MPLLRQESLLQELNVLEKVKRLDKYKYGQRWAAETFLSGVKRIFGETTKTKTKEPFTNCSTKHFLSIKI